MIILTWGGIFGGGEKDAMNMRGSMATSVHKLARWNILNQEEESPEFVMKADDVLDPWYPHLEGMFAWEENEANI